MAHDQSDLLQGTLEPLHGWGISLRRRQMSREVCQVNQGSLYAVLQRMQSKGRERAQWERSVTAVHSILGSTRGEV